MISRTAFSLIFKGLVRCIMKFGKILAHFSTNLSKKGCEFLNSYRILNSIGLMSSDTSTYVSLL